MTKKQFIAIALTLNANRADLALVLDFADMCAEQSRLFNRRMFINAATENIRKDREVNDRILARALAL